MATQETPLISIAEVNRWTREQFIERIGPIFEHSPWIAAETWSAAPFASHETLLRHLCETMRRAPLEKQIALIQAHPDLAGRMAAQGQLTAASTAEQAHAGLDRLSAAEIAQFNKVNIRYREKFGFPFVICAKLNAKQAILAAFHKRLESDRTTEIKTALAEIEKIAALRLAQIVRTGD